MPYSKKQVEQRKAKKADQKLAEEIGAASPKFSFYAKLRKEAKVLGAPAFHS
ncbi:MAG: hypothetical protein WB438_13730 [Candidatus Cybelea sp.]